ncbi:GTPase HflX [Kineococcus sp. SYSU DK001]|uniref:GTPase HflX n=1 Tax=Kineococcus sp. SYSU DK001 TaxID=3383122 RepID=UPI003D7D7DD4
MPGNWLVGRSPDAPAEDETLTAVALAVDTGEHDVDDALHELHRLAATDGVEITVDVRQNRDHPDPATYVGRGKVAEVADALQRTGARLVIADDELSPAQVRSLEGGLGVRVVDRTALVLDIFAQHARSSEGRTQVELAQIAYQLPRLRGSSRNLSRVGGGRVAAGQGIGVRGPGETRLESERRRLRRRANDLRRQATAIAARRQRTRDRRSRNAVPSAALTGYTDVGKSALLNRLAAADVEVRAELFATLDPTVRRIVVEDVAFTLTDTVGFVRNLPHQLVDAFHSTLEEVVQADLAVHVVDAAAPDALDRLSTVRGVLREIGAADVPELLVLNKVDVAPPDRVTELQRLHPQALTVSALTGEGVPELRSALAHRLRREP